MSRFPRRLEVKLLNIEAGGIKVDEDGHILAAILTKIGNVTSSCSARSYLASVDEAERSSWQELKADIMKYMKVNDRYLSLVSVLLKSQAFHETHGREVSTWTGPRCIVDLPRTIHNKPYIPSEQKLPPDDEDNLYPLSISHQYPFAGSIRWVLPCEPRLAMDGRRLYAGLDIVVFDKINPRLYDTVQDFVNVFPDSFAASEWAAMNDRIRCPDDESQLRELYLRWAIKEAYTKALGVGMAFEFSGFETVLDSLDDQTSLSSWVCQWTGGLPLRTTGSVVQVTSEGKNNHTFKRLENEQWLFFFQPLYDSPELPTLEPSLLLRGCGCICVGPFESIDETDDICIRVEWTYLKELMTWHGVS